MRSQTMPMPLIHSDDACLHVTEAPEDRERLGGDVLAAGRELAVRPGHHLAVLVAIGVGREGCVHGGEGLSDLAAQAFAVADGRDTLRRARGGATPETEQQYQSDDRPALHRIPPNCPRVNCYLSITTTTSYGVLPKFRN